MTREITGEVLIHAPAETVWDILGKNYSRIGDWASVIQQSASMEHLSIPRGSDAGGRSCTPTLPFVRAVTEELTYFDEATKTFRYEATSGLPGFINKAENTWSVVEAGPDQCIVKTVGRLSMKQIPGALIFPVFKWQLSRAGAQLVEELKYYAENGRPHPRKAKLLARV